MSTNYGSREGFVKTSRVVTWMDGGGKLHTADLYTVSVFVQKWDGVDAHMAVLLPDLSEGMGRAIFAYVKMEYIGEVGRVEGQRHAYMTFVAEDGDQGTVIAMVKEV